MKCQPCVTGDVIILVGILIFLGRTNAAIKDSSIGAFDFIVVGGGAAGCAIAGRLSENGEHTVLLLEAGGLPHPEFEIPALTPLLILLSNDSRNEISHSIKRYRSVPQDNAALLTNGTFTFLTGRTLGGGSSINSMLFNRGHPRDYQIWSERTGDPSWTYENMLKYFKKVEDYAGNFPSEQHGYGGPITVSGPRYAPGIGTLFAAGNFLGYSVADQNGPQQISFTPAERATKLGRRVSSLKGYIEPIITSRRNLQITLNAYARRILFEGNRAVGIIYRTNSQDFVVRAAKEIIITAGVIESPSLLMKSGIGPRDVLQENEIPPVSLLPVGKNLQDHILVLLNFSINDTSPNQVYIVERELTPEKFALYNSTGSGPYATYGGTEVQAFVSSSIAKREGNGEWSDLQILFTNGSPQGISNGVEDSGNNWEENGEMSVEVRVFLTRPQSTGEVGLNKVDPEGDPRIDFRHLKNKQDIEILMDGIKQTLQIYEDTPSFQLIGAKYQRMSLPACDHLTFRSDNYWRCYIMYNTRSGLHAVGTCSMGKGPNDPRAVVDTDLKVVGVKGLRVADGSVIPKLPNANPLAPIYAIAEKASEKILNSWRTVSSPATYNDLWS